MWSRSCLSKRQSYNREINLEVVLIKSTLLFSLTIETALDTSYWKYIAQPQKHILLRFMHYLFKLHIASVNRNHSKKYRKIFSYRNVFIQCHVFGQIVRGFLMSRSLILLCSPYWEIITFSIILHEKL